MKSRARALSAAVLAFAVTSPANAFVAPPDGAVLPTFDVRELDTAALQPEVVRELRPEVQAMVEARLGVPVRLAFDYHRDVPHTLRPVDTAHRLTAPSTDDGLVIARRFLDDMSFLYGLSALEIDALEPDTDYVTDFNGRRHIWFQQKIDGVPVRGGRIGVNLSALGEVMSVHAGPYVAGLTPAAAAGIEVAEAVVIGAGYVREEFADGAAPALVATLGPRSYEFAAAQFGAPIHAEQMYFPTRGGARLAWKVTYNTPWQEAAIYDVYVDAASGELLYRVNITNYFAACFTCLARGYDVHPEQTPVSRVWPLDAASTGPQSPIGWYDELFDSGVTHSNNVIAHGDRVGCTDGPTFQEVPVSIPLYDFTNFPIDLAQAPDTYLNFAITNLFVLNNFIHDRVYDYGFTEAAGNFQTDNFGWLPIGNGDGDPVNAQAQDAALCPRRNNANFSTPADGAEGTMQMYIWDSWQGNPIVPNRDGDLDADIVIHEFGHGISQRLVAGRSCAGGCALTNLQGGAMGESWGDIIASSYADHDVTGEYSLKDPNGVRFAGPFGSSALTLKDIGWTGCGSVHDNGEVMSAMLWAVREGFVARYGGGVMDLSQGPRKFERYIIQGLIDTPMDPSFLEFRDAMIASAANLIDECIMWEGFAAKGAGENAVLNNVCPFSGTEDTTVPDKCACVPGGPGVNANSLRATRQGPGSAWEWTSPGLGTWNLHSDILKGNIPGMWSIDVTKVASPVAPDVIDAVGTFPVGFYQVYGVDACSGESVP